MVHPELACHDRERRAFRVACRGPRHGLVGHLADHAPSGDAGSVEVVDDGGPVDLVPTGEPVYRDTVSVLVDQLLDLGSRQPPLHRV